MSTQLQTLIDATGFDTYEQALDFVREARETYTAAEAAQVHPATTEERDEFKAMMLKHLAPDMVRENEKLRQSIRKMWDIAFDLAAEYSEFNPYMKGMDKEAQWKRFLETNGLNENRSAAE